MIGSVASGPSWPITPPWSPSPPPVEDGLVVPPLLPVEDGSAFPPLQSSEEDRRSYLLGVQQWATDGLAEMDGIFSDTAMPSEGTSNCTSSPDTPPQPPQWRPTGYYYNQQCAQEVVSQLPAMTAADEEVVRGMKSHWLVSGSDEFENIKPSSWTDQEEQACMDIVPQIERKGSTKTLAGLWKAVEAEMQRHGFRRTDGSIRNAWARTLRERSGFDERVKKRPGAMRTGQARPNDKQRVGRVGKSGRTYRVERVSKKQK